ncbi:MAG: sigma-70 family RNA polymerase sigma factor [Polyangiaceae bacterium]|nr:sigma-70 family RNA polymerase sigma factor [Polyangiaceae bacterium]
MPSDLALDSETGASPGAEALTELACPVEAVARAYDEFFDFAWRTLRRLGVPPEQLEDAVHDLFLVVHQRRSTFRHESSLKTWLFGIGRAELLKNRRASGRQKDLADIEAIEALAPARRRSRVARGGTRRPR